MDLNHRPLGYEPNELPDCSTPRKHHNNRRNRRQTCTSTTLCPNSCFTKTPARLGHYPQPLVDKFQISSRDLQRQSPTTISFTNQFFSLWRSHADTIFVGSMASLSTCSSRIFPSFPIRKLIRRAALYLST